MQIGVMDAHQGLFRPDPVHNPREHAGSVPDMPETLSVSAALEELTGHEAWAVIRLRESPTVTLVGGSLDHLERLADIPLEDGVPENGRRFDRLVAVPFRQVTERGFVAHDDGTPLAVVDIETEREVLIEELIAALPDEEVTFEDPGGFDTSDEDYAGVVARIIRDEIGNGEGANLVVGRHYRAQPRGWSGPAQDWAGSGRVVRWPTAGGE